MISFFSFLFPPFLLNSATIIKVLYEPSKGGGGEEGGTFPSLKLTYKEKSPKEKGKYRRAGGVAVTPATAKPQRNVCLKASDSSTNGCKCISYFFKTNTYRVYLDTIRGIKDPLPGGSKTGMSEDPACFTPAFLQS